MMDLLIRGGTLIDPARGVNQKLRDLWISNGKVVDAPTSEGERAARVIDARGLIVMPGGVDVHSHIAGSKVNASRALRPEERGDRERSIARKPGMRSGGLGSSPTTFATGYLYAGLGYTTVVDASIPPLLARQAHQEFADTPLIDKAFLALMGNNHLILDFIREGDQAKVREAVAWLLNASKGYGVKVVNPGGVERWKLGKGNVVTLDDRIEHFEVTPREILTGVVRAVDDLKLPHPVHLHGLNLGSPGNWSTTLETMQALQGHRVHLAHIQFHSYGEADAKTGRFESRVEELAAFVNENEGITVDVGQVLFGETTSMTADGSVGHLLAKVTGRKWVNVDVEMETGCGVVPITYSDKNAVHALQWAIGLEWFLRVNDPWKIALSTDHPNGGSFLAYPKLMALLMDRNLRAEGLAKLPESVRTRVKLGELTREYTLEEIAIITRAAPARMLGLREKGHLAPGADADVAIYSPAADIERMFQVPKYVIKGGAIVVDDGEVRPAPLGRTLYVERACDPAFVPEVVRHFDRESSIALANYPVGPDEVANPWAGSSES